ncbi:hypothetical protein [Zhihengliuella halotolerans]|uniref:hypothetical protein n=1 Tax=Zhihengliuella halotolerans TaxID=370736 RepID=UPI001CA4984E|nr:hypothetical protein [Zhihengliuella halotolerans]
MSSEAATPDAGTSAQIPHLQRSIDVSGADWPERLEPTGEPEIDAALDVLADVPSSALDGHVAVFENVHSLLRESLEASEHLATEDALPENDA